MSRPNFFIIGAPKCGTTALAAYLSEHPSVFITNPKEPHHFNTDLNHGSYKSDKDYRSLFLGVSDSVSAVGEASVWYLYSDTAIPNILSKYPDAKFIVMLRNPVEMVYSLHEQMVFSNYENVSSFMDAWALQACRRNGENCPRMCPEPKLLQYKSACSLGFQYERLLSRVDRRKLYTVFYDDFKENPKKVWESLLSFLSVPDDGRVDFPVINSAKKRKSHMLMRVNDLYAKARSTIGFSGFGTGLFSRLNRWNMVFAPREPLPKEFDNLLRREFESDIKLLGELTNRDLRHWLESN
ncbi:sulfotransferase family protein [Marinobacter koreensis]|uniref:Sulfotransferase family protein n=1 Tax=Marinobacter koreensis TaxID=335974 RepID=A0ABW0RI45_9GAMM|nr:sulfotransferase [Marinobacter koreensis]MCK7546989.1 sulfotransferase [Marinobacter koreensis]